jgi:hypothetical protein
MAQFFAAGALGAQYGPGLIRKVLDAGRTWRAVLLTGFAAVFSAVLTLVWGATLVEGLPLVALVLGLAAWSGWVVLVECVARWVHAPHRPGPVLTTSPAGLPATAWVRSGWALARPWATVAALAVTVVGEVVAWLRSDESAWFLLGAALVAALVVVTLWPARRGVRAGGLYLTREGLEHVWGPALTQVAWDDVRVVPPLALERTEGLRRLRRGEWWCVDRTDRVRRAVPVPSAYLGDPPDVVRRRLLDLAAHPSARRDLGTSASLHR